ncbi:MAG TPA: hypothetical protein VGQ36_10005 [Thermoanaerobaculia bacterium]|nr:hypothetical protein [Thermoanaerobaculia bacterium]
MKIRIIITALALSLTVAVTADEAAKAQGADRSVKAESTDTWFARYDANKDDKLTPEEFRGGKTLFAAYDVNADGTLTREEVKSAKGASTRPSFRALDTDKDGFVTRREWTGTQEEFDAVDLDNDGVWSKADLAAEKFRTQAKGLIERLDTDKDGVLSGDEWAAAQRDAASFRRQDLNRNGTLDLDELATPVKE